MRNTSPDRQPDFIGATGVTTARPRPPSEPTLRLGSVTDFLGPGPRLQDLAEARNIRFTYSGRYAIYHALRSLASVTNRRVVLVPAFHCPTVVDPILHAGFRVRFYEVTTDLRACKPDFERKISAEVAAAVLIRYFGLPSGADSLIEVCRTAGIMSIDDWSHSFLECNPLRLAQHGADVTIYSFKKLVPSQSGGGAVAKDVPNWPSELKRSPLQDSTARLRALWGNARAFRPSFRSPGDIDSPVVKRLLEESQPAIRRPAAIAYPYDSSLAALRIPFSSRLILARSPLQEVADRRRRNYRLMTQALRFTSWIKAVNPDLPEETCPWGLPTLLENRSAHDYQLRALGVPLFTFGEVLHPALFETHAGETRMLASSRYLADSLLALSIHQDLDESFVGQSAQIINAYFARQ